MKTTVIVMIASLACWAPALGADPDAKPEELPAGFCLVEEMRFIPEVDSWSRCEPGTYGEETEAVRKAWPAEAARIGKFVTPEVARRLSRWGRPQMDAYAEVPPLAKVRLEPVSHYPERRMLVLRGTVDTLPVHAPLVTRWLQVYVLYDAPAGSIERVTVTVRGERRE